MSGSAGPRVLYLSYDGALEPLGQSQVLAYLRELAPRCAGITLISYEKPGDLRDASRVAALRQDLAAANIRWRPLRYHKRPTLAATSWDVAAGIAAALAVAARRGVDVVHARSYVSALQAWCLKRLAGTPWIFDMRGFWADERVEGGLWKADGFLYRLVKRLERAFVADADAIVTLTHRAAATVRAWSGGEGRRVEVIPTCVDLARFHAPAATPPPGSAPRFVYAGSAGTCYGFDEMLRFFARARRRFPDSSLVVLTRSVAEARASLERSGLPPGAVTVETAAPADMPRSLAGAHAGLAFYRNGFSREGTCPTKLGEYLALGIPVVVNGAVGDVQALIAGNRVGVVVETFDDRAYDAALESLAHLWSDGGLAAQCRAVAESVFSLQMGADRYWSIYERLTAVEGRTVPVRTRGPLA